jgi:hypothetical protein
VDVPLDETGHDRSPSEIHGSDTRRRIASNGSDPSVADRDGGGNRIAHVHRVDAPVRQHDILRWSASRWCGLSCLCDLRLGLTRSSSEGEGAGGAAQELTAGAFGHFRSVILDY